MASAVSNFNLSPSNYFSLNLEKRAHSSYPVRCLAGRDLAAALSSDAVKVNGTVNGILKEESKRALTSNYENGHVSLKVEDKVYEEKLEPLWDDGYGSETVKNYLDYANEIIKPDGGPPRWFTPISCGPHLRDSPVLFFLPVHKNWLFCFGLRVFDVWCMHIPVQDRTPFEELVERVSQTVRAEHSLSPNKPIYIVGDSFGGCLALAVAARNPQIDLVMILANPATSFGRSQLQPLLPFLEALPDELHILVPYMLSFVMGDPMKMAAVNVNTLQPPTKYFEQLSANLTALLPRLSGLADIIPKETLLWKLKLLKRAAAYANSRLHAVKAEVLVLASGKDNMLPSRDEASKLLSTLQNCKMRYFNDNGHTILLEDGINLLTIIKGTSTYRRSSKHDYIMDFVPPSKSEFKLAIDGTGWFMNYVSPVLLSTTEDGKIVPGLAGVPDEGPVMLVGNHMLMGAELIPLVEEFLREKKINVRGMAHPTLFAPLVENENKEFSFSDYMKIYGALPVTPNNLFKLLNMNSHVLLYPGGAREALHRKGEEYQLFWPDQPEFVRMAARFGATIVPFGVVGEDDLAELALDYDDLLKIPIWGDRVREENEKYDSFNVRAGKSGEVANQALYLPMLLPKFPGRLYCLFGKPIHTKGLQKDLLKDREKAMELYLQTKSDVEKNISYLLEKRNEDPYRGIVDRTIYRALYTPFDRVPTFEP
ncbi:esterase/lipase/thioesterase family protein [Striga asiatica]|uniref:Esterase/lipase/thioesterase family protein n=1 Tax=Striga asiatica TaxID=4170 RepID=A0A5A7Q7W8_STRAF|nr:esterase/lipase/thioesterase family protein [Striga asiatica]